MPQPEIAWSYTTISSGQLQPLTEDRAKINATFLGTDQNGRFVVKSTLTLISVQPKDGGIVSCTVGSSQTATAILNVLGVLHQCKMFAQV